jgi:cell wall-associated NlpC family hydrolase
MIAQKYIAQKYRDIPYLDGGRTVSGADCWGVVRLVLINEYGVPWLPSWGHIREASHNEIDAAYKSSRGVFFRVLLEGSGINAAVKSGDVVCVFNPRGECAHVGVVVPGDTGPTVLHTRPESGVSTLPLARFAAFYDHRIEYWRYASDKSL